MEVFAQFLPPSSMDAVRERDSGRPATPAQNVPSNGVVLNDASVMAAAVSSQSSSSSSSQVLDANSFGDNKKKANKARSTLPIGHHRPNTFWPSWSPPPPFPSNTICHNYPYAPPPYIPTLPPSSLPPPSLPFWDNTCIYTPCATSFAPSPLLPELTHLRHMIAKQINYYFSDDNLAKDVYLRTRMDDEGWVPITLIAGFRRVSALSKDIKFILDSMIYSDMVEVKGQKLRRRGTWKKWLLNLLKR